MAAFLTVDTLRAPAARLPQHDMLRPALVVRWVLAPDGRLTGQWQTQARATFGPPPH
jgi:hypothetical protein